jgi:hypothetical protein
VESRSDSTSHGRQRIARIGAGAWDRRGLRLGASTGPQTAVLRDDVGMAPLTSRVLTAVATGVTGCGVVLGVADGDGAATAACLAALVAVATGWVVVRREPASAVGPALAWSGAGVAFVLAVEILARSAYDASPLPLAELARLLWVGVWPIHLAGVLVLLLVFPDGRLRSRLWSAVPVAYLAGTVAMVLSSWGAREVDGRVVEGSTGTLARVAGVGGIVVIGTCLVLAAGSVVVRYRRGDDRRREQIRWMMLAAGATVAALLLGWVAQAFGAALAVAYTPFLIGVVVLMPLAVGIAIVRHDLFDVDRMLGATTTWTLTLMGSAAVFAAVVLFAGRVVGASTGLAPTAAAFVTALTLLPLQRFLIGHWAFRRPRPLRNASRGGGIRV